VSGFGDTSAFARRITRLAESIKLPRRRRHVRTASGSLPAGPALVRGRGLARRRPRSPLSYLLAGLVYLLLGAAATLALTRLLP
jgi:hypothetical protein